MFIPLVAIVFVFLYSTSIQNRQELAKDRLALKELRNRAAAESALWKQLMSKPMPHLEDPLLSSSPGLAKRLKALRAVDLG